MLESFNGNTETILLLGIVVFVVVSLLGLILWNAKTNKQVKALTSIDVSLKHLDFQETAVSKTADEQGVAEPAASDAKTDAPTAEETAVPEASQEVQALPEETATARSGRVYSRQELEALIRD